jgi:hypothetical protein
VALEASDRARVDARLKADAIYVDDSDERSQGSVGLGAGAGFLRLSPGNMLGAAGGAAFGVQALAHLGFWSTAPARGLANGFELRLLGRLWGSAALAPVFNVEGLLTARYYFGFFGVGLAGDLRYLDWTTAGQPQQSKLIMGVGPSVSFALIDNRRMRLLAGVHWTPFISSDWLRVTGDVEFSWKLLTISVAAGRASDGPTEAQRGGFFVGAFAGIRYPW